MRNSEFASAPPIARVILYVKDIPKVAAFYERFFGMIRMEGSSDGWQELTSPAGGCTIALHQAAVSQKSGAAMKLVFGVADVEGFRVTAEKKGLRFGVVHRAEEKWKAVRILQRQRPRRQLHQHFQPGVGRTKQGRFAYELPEAARSISTRRKFPKDLSTNSRHFKEFGKDK
jgi:predicted enzyme related to lactoylglutathione lyase